MVATTNINEVPGKLSDWNEKFVVVDTADTAGNPKAKLVASSEISKTWHTHTASQITDFDAEVTNNATVAWLVTSKLDKEWDLRTGNGAWKVMYNNGDWDETVLALWDDGHFLKSNWPSAAPSFSPPSVPDASETEKGIVEKATDVEAYWGSDSQRFITPAQRAPLVALLQTTRDITAASWTVDIAHWLWYAPSYIKVTAKYNWRDNQSTSSDGFSDGTASICTTYSINTSEWSSSIVASNQWSSCVFIVDTDGWWSWNDKVRQSATATFDGTNITLSRTKFEAGSVLIDSNLIYISILAVY